MGDLRDWLARAEALGELKTLAGVSWDLEMGAIAELVGRRWDKSAILFDDIPGYPAGYRILINPLGSRRRFALAVGFPTEMSVLEMVQEWRRRSQTMGLLPPRFVDGGPVMENSLLGEEVNLLQFPVPRWHEEDGGRYIGTGDMVITREADGPWVNFGTYRSMVHDRNHVGLQIGVTHHGAWHMREWFARGEPMPVAIVVGMDPLLFLASCSEVPAKVSEYDYVGAIRGEPVEVIRGPITGLPIPADAEIVLEGFVDPHEQWLEGPFGEHLGYYAGGARPEPLVKVEAIHFRHDPIILGKPPLRPPDITLQYWNLVLRGARLWDILEGAGVPDVTGVWFHMAHMLRVVAIRQRYPGHAKQAGRIASQNTVGIARFTVVVDEDIDVTDIDEVLWAMCTRVDPDRDIEVLRGCVSSTVDPMVTPEKRAHPTVSKVVIDATRPYEWRERFPAVVASSPELKEKVLSRWGEKLREIL